MKIDALKNNEELKQQVKEVFDKTEDKNDAVYQAIDMVVSAKYQTLIKELQDENEKAAHDSEYKKALGLRSLSAGEKQFYEGLRNAKQAVTAAQIDIIPTELVNRTMADLKKTSNVLTLVNFAPADVKHWIAGSHSGTAVWGALTDAVVGELNATITGLNIEVNKLTAYLPIPKAVRELSYEFADVYFRAILAEAMQDGLEAGYLNGDGKTGPIGIMRMIDTTEVDGTRKAKTAVTVTAFSPKGLSAVRKTLTNGGKRVVPEIALICNPMDEAEYVDPALYGEAPEGGYKNVSFVNLTKYVTTNCPAGKAVLTLPGVYTMGLNGVRIDEYKETKAMEDVDLLIGKGYGNGRADDDNAAVVIDVTKLVEYVPTFMTKAAA